MVVIKYKNSCLSIVLLLSGCSASRVDNDKGLGIDPDSFPAKHSAVTALNPLLREDMATSQIDMYKSKVEADLQASLDKLSCPEKHLQVSLNRVYKFIEEYREIVDNITNVVKDPIHGVEGIDAAVTSYIERLLRMMDKMKREIYESAKTWEIREERFELYRMFMQITSGVCSNKTRKIYESIDSGITEPTNRKTILHAISNVLVSSKSLAELCLQQFEKSGGKLQDVFYIKPLSIDLQIDVMITSCNGQLPSQSSRDVANESVVDEHKGDASVKSDVSYDLATQAALTAKSITDEMIAKIAAAKAKKSGLKSLVDEIYDELTNMLADKGRAMLKELVSSADDSKVRVLQASFTSEEAFEDISKEPATFVSTAFLPNISQVPLHDENPESMAALEVAPEKGTPEEILIRFSCIDNLVIKCIKKFSQDLLAYERWVRYVLLIIENSGSTKFGIDRNVAFFLEDIYIIMNNISVEIFESIVNAIEKGDDRQYINIYIQAVNAVNSHEMKNLYEKIKIGITDKQTKGKICKCINELFKSTMYLAYASIMLFNKSGCKISDIFSKNIFNTDIKDESIKNSCGEDNVDKDNGKGEKTDEEPKNVTKVKKDESIGEGTSTVDEPKKTPGNEIVTEDKKDESIEEGTGTDDEPKSAPDIEIVTEDIKDESTVEGTGTDDAPISASSGASVTERKKDESKVEGTGNDDVISKIAAYSKDLTSKLVAKILDAKNKGIDSTVLVDDIFEEMTVVLASKGKAELVELLKGMIEFAADDYATEVDVKGSNE